MLPENVKIIIPARRNSKGFPFKNRKLLDYTLKSIPKKYRDRVWITTDDEKIIRDYNKDYRIIVRPDILAQDTTSMFSVLYHMLLSYPKEFKKSDTIIMLYLTYPHRKWRTVIKALSFFNENKAKSLLCRMEVLSNPYLMMHDRGLYGNQVIHHNLYRRQDYPSVFEISHCVSIFKVREIENLNSNLWNKNTVFFPIERHIDVDYKNQIKP